MGSEKVGILAMLALVIISESRLTGELIRSEIKSVCDKMDRLPERIAKELRDLQEGKIRR